MATDGYRLAVGANKVCMIQKEENRWVLSEILKLENVDCWQTERGSLFQETEPETEEACGPKVLCFVPEPVEMCQKRRGMLIFFSS